MKRGATQRPRQRLTAQPAPTLDQRPAQQVESGDKDHQYAKRRHQRYIMDTQKAVAEAATRVDDRVQVRHSPCQNGGSSVSE